MSEALSVRINRLRGCPTARLTSSGDSWCDCGREGQPYTPDYRPHGEPRGQGRMPDWLSPARSFQLIAEMIDEGHYLDLYRDPDGVYHASEWHTDTGANDFKLTHAVAEAWIRAVKDATGNEHGAWTL